MLTDLLPLVTWNVSPICFSLGFITIRWYGIFFAAGVFLFSRNMESDSKIALVIPLAKDQESMLSYAIMSTIIGAKIGYVFLYAPKSLWWSTLWTLQGFSFHGGIVGILVYMTYLARQYKFQCLILLDRFSVAVPWSLALGRLGNFFNSELIGRPTNAPWGILFPFGESHPLPRYPSQIYEGFGEGVILGYALYLFDQYGFHQPPGILSSFFLIGYGTIRLFLEPFRQPDPQIGLLGNGWTLGQILCLIMIAMGLLLWTSLKTYHNSLVKEGQTL